MRYDSVFWTLLLVSTLFTPLLSGAEQSPLPVVVANDNRTPAGGLKDGVLHLRLELRQARWYAEGADGVYEDVYAFAEEGHPPQSSGPLLRVPQGTRIHASLRNLLPSAAKVYGLHSHPGEPGTYMYWATTSDAHLDHVDERQGEEGLLMGASIVDPPGVNEHDRIFVIVAR